MQVLLDTKEKAIQAMLDENRHNTNTLLAAAKTQEVRQTSFYSFIVIIFLIIFLEEYPIWCLMISILNKIKPTLKQVQFSLDPLYPAEAHAWILVVTHRWK